MPRPYKLPEDVDEIEPRLFTRRFVLKIFDRWDRASLDDPESGLEISASIERFAVRVGDHSAELGRLAAEIHNKALCARAGSLKALRRFDEAETCLLQGLEEVGDDDLGRANLLRNFALLRGHQLRYAEAMELAEQAVALAQGDQQILGKAVMCRGILLFYRGMPREAMMALLRALSLLDHRQGLAVYFKALYNLMTILVEVREGTGADVRNFKAELQHLRTRIPVNSAFLRRHFRWVEGLAALRFGAFHLAVENLGDLLPKIDDDLSPQERFHLRVDLAQACTRVGDRRRAAVLMGQCVGILRGQGREPEIVGQVEAVAVALARGRRCWPWDVRGV